MPTIRHRKENNTKSRTRQRKRNRGVLKSLAIKIEKKKWSNFMKDMETRQSATKAKKAELKTSSQAEEDIISKQIRDEAL